MQFHTESAEERLLEKRGGERPRSLSPVAAEVMEKRRSRRREHIALDTQRGAGHCLQDTYKRNGYELCFSKIGVHANLFEKGVCEVWRF